MVYYAKNFPAYHTIFRKLKKIKKFPLSFAWGN